MLYVYFIICSSSQRTLFQIELLQRILLEHHTKGFHDLSEKFWDKVNTLLAKVLNERAQGINYICSHIINMYHILG